MSALQGVHTHEHRQGVCTLEHTRQGCALVPQGNAHTSAASWGVRGAHLTPRGWELVGTVEVSFKDDMRGPFLTLNPPSGVPYLCNMAVCTDRRRCGIGARLLHSAEGYKSKGTDMIFMSLAGQKRRQLMTKMLQ
ncbi:hypothetical protein CYMTET_6350 [Cymbomonas tetramitiformis]|uniref:N-acetyltransferase domain-containing protein n=1 Tax=Cymbomonas tetramitiformis TaxID=36881 RepID=A0AAE0GXB0_9CHLO|nr:hypothetical protein CYMTET_6350 [Cymbomonas tetramitiformis]